MNENILLKFFEMIDDDDGIIASNCRKVYYFNRCISRILNKKNRARYGIYAAEKVLPIFENVKPDNKNPRRVIEAAKCYEKYPTKENAREALKIASDLEFELANGLEEKLSWEALPVCFAAISAARAAAWDAEDESEDEAAAFAAKSAAFAAKAMECEYKKASGLSFCMGKNGAYISTMKDIIKYGLELLKEQDIE